MTITDDKALDLLREHFCEPQGWDWAGDYGERGYSLDGDQRVVVVGHYWCPCRNHPHAGRLDHSLRREIKPGDLHTLDLHHPWLWARFEEVASFEWSDEWVVSDGKAYRTSPDSYLWQPSTRYTEDGDLLTPDDDAETWLELLGVEHQPIALNPRQVDLSELQALGFEFWPDDDSFFETGWHPHQTDDPYAQIERCRAERDDEMQFVVWIAGVGQFDSRWKILCRIAPQEGP